MLSKLSKLPFFLFFSFSCFAQTRDEVKSFLQSSPPSLLFLKTIYETRGFEPLFAKNNLWVLSSKDLQAIEAAIRSHGLSSSDYKTRQIFELLKKKPDLKTELFISENILKSVLHISVGRIDPRKVSEDIKFQPKEFVKWDSLRSITPSQLPALFEEVAPKNPYYQTVKQVLSRLREIQSQKLWVHTPAPESSVSPGQTHPTIFGIKKKLMLLGFSFNNKNAVFDNEFQAALDSIYHNLSSSPEKGISKDSKIWRVINFDMSSRIREAELQLEKTRWLPHEIETRHAFANIASQMFYVQDLDLSASSYVLQFRAVVGQVGKKTSSMSDKIHALILNPSYTVTLNSFLYEKLPFIQKDFKYLERNGYRVISLKTDQELDPKKISWPQITRGNIDFQLVQQPGDTNPLGKVKFLLTNRHSIYLHDSNEKKVFTNSFRLSGPGPVKLEKPIDLVEYLLSNSLWNRNRIDSTLGGPAVETYIKLSKPLNTYFLSLSVFLSGNKIQFFEDHYGQNTMLYKKLTQEGYLKN